MKWNTPTPHLFGVCAVFLGTGSFFLWSGTGIAMEDAAIHLAMAKGLFSEGFFSLTSGVPAGAVTSPLWIVLEAIPLALFGSITAATTFMTLLTAGCLMGTLWLLFSQDSPWIAGMMIGFCFLAGPIQWHLWSGMETMLFTACCLGVLGAMRKGQDRAAGLWLFAAILTRMEAILFLPAVGVWAFRATRGELGKKRFPGRWTLLLGAIAFVVFGGINSFQTGHFLPTTGEGKRFLYGIYLSGLDAVPLLPSRLLGLIEDWARFLYGAYARNGSGSFLFWLGVACIPVAGIQIWKQRLVSSALFLLFCAVITGVYAIELPVRDVAGRYQGMNLLILPLAMAIVVDSARHILRPLAVGVALAGVGLHGLSLPSWASARVTQHTHLEMVHRKAGEWIQHTNTDCLPIFLGEIGWISYANKSQECPAAILDYYALADPVYFQDASRGRGLSGALHPGDKAIFAISMLSTNFPSIHLRLVFPDGEPGSWTDGETYRVTEQMTGRRFSFQMEKRFSHSFPEQPDYSHPAGRITGMNPILVGYLTALPESGASVDERHQHQGRISPIVRNFVDYD